MLKVLRQLFSKTKQWTTVVRESNGRNRNNNSNSNQIYNGIGKLGQNGIGKQSYSKINIRKDMTDVSSTNINNINNISKISNNYNNTSQARQTINSPNTYPPLSSLSLLQLANLTTTLRHNSNNNNNRHHTTIQFYNNLQVQLVNRLEPTTNSGKIRAYSKIIYQLAKNKYGKGKGGGEGRDVLIGQGEGGFQNNRELWEQGGFKGQRGLQGQRGLKRYKGQNNNSIQKNNSNMNQLTLTPNPNNIPAHFKSTQIIPNIGISISHTFYQSSFGMMLPFATPQSLTQMSVSLSRMGPLSQQYTNILANVFQRRINQFNVREKVMIEYLLARNGYRGHTGVDWELVRDVPKMNLREILLMLKSHQLKLEMYNNDKLGQQTNMESAICFNQTSKGKDQQISYPSFDQQIVKLMDKTLYAILLRRKQINLLDYVDIVKLYSRKIEKSIQMKRDQNGTIHSTHNNYAQQYQQLLQILQAMLPSFIPIIDSNSLITIYQYFGPFIQELPIKMVDQLLSILKIMRMKRIVKDKQFYYIKDKIVKKYVRNKEILSKMSHIY